MGFVLAAGVLPLALFGIPSSALVNRFGARRTLIASDLARAPLIALIPALHGLGALSFPLLLAIVFAVGAAGAPYFASKRLILPELLGDDPHVVSQANSAIEGANRVTGLFGPVAAGFLIAALGASSVLWLDAASFLVSFLLLVVFVPRREPIAAEGEETRGIVAALRFLARDRLLGGMALTVVLFGMFWPVLFASLPVLAYAHHRDAKLAGYLFALWGAGTSAGSLLAFGAARRFAPLRLARCAIVGVTFPLAALALGDSPWLVGAVLALTGLFIPLLNAPVLSTFTLRTPAHLRAHVLTTVTTCEELAGPIVLTAAGPAIQAFGLRPTYGLVAAGGALAAAVFLLATAPTRGVTTSDADRRPGAARTR
jgi:MFS family permease